MYCVIINWVLAGTYLTAIGPTVIIALYFRLGFVMVLPCVVIYNSDILCLTVQIALQSHYCHVNVTGC